VEMASRTLGIYALVLDAKDEQALQWYLRLDFGLQAFPENPSRLFVPMSFIKQLKLGPLTARL